MRPALRLLASVQRTSQFLEPGAPTGITGLFTHAAPRSTLLYLYSNTLEKLQQFPESSVYRQSTEALSKHRLSILESIKPQGLEEWQQRVQAAVDAHPEAFRKIPISTPNSGEKAFNIIWRAHAAEGMKTQEWDDEAVGKPAPEGPRDESEKANMGQMMQRDLREENAKIPRIEPEPALTAEQIGEIETKLGAGLIEEVIQVAEGENRLVDIMLENKVYVLHLSIGGSWMAMLTDSQVGGPRGKPERGPVGVLRARQAHSDDPGAVEHFCLVLENRWQAKSALYICIRYQLTCPLARYTIPVSAHYPVKSTRDANRQFKEHSKISETSKREGHLPSRCAKRTYREVAGHCSIAYTVDHRTPM